MSGWIRNNDLWIAASLAGTLVIGAFGPAVAARLENATLPSWGDSLAPVAAGNTEQSQGSFPRTRGRIVHANYVEFGCGWRPGAPPPRLVFEQGGCY